MLQIKTIQFRMDYANKFDEKVNEAIAEGWTLTKREVIQAVDCGEVYFHRMLYAELEREIITEAERCCGNCKYGEQDGGEPCDSCDEETWDKWEEAKV